VTETPTAKPSPYQLNPEQEWRWVVPDEIYEFDWCRREDICNGGPYPSLPLFLAPEENGYFSKLVIFVRTNQEAESIIEKLTGLYLSCFNQHGMHYSPSVIEDTRLIVLEDIIHKFAHVRNNTPTMDTLESVDLLEAYRVVEIPGNTYARIEKAISTATEQAIAMNVSLGVNHSSGGDFLGFTYVYTTDILSPVVQCMLINAIIKGPYDDEYALFFDLTSDNSPSENYHEAAYKEFANSLSESLGVNFYIKTVSDW